MLKSNKYIKLFLSTFNISAFTFGGGYVIVPLIKKKFVEELKWIDEEEMLNYMAIAQSAPGPIAINVSLLVGYRMAGIKGALVTVLGTSLPPLVIISVISLFYSYFRDNEAIKAVLKGMQAGVAAVIADVVLSMGGNVVKNKDIISIAIMACAFIATYFIGINVVFIILTCGILGAVRVMITQKRKERSEV